MIAIVPNSLNDAINIKLDMAFQKMPEAEIDREALYHQLLQFFDDNGYVPEFTITRRPHDT
jgi:hypothetical protein